MRILIALSIIITLFSCGKQRLSPVEYVRWVETEENGMKQKQVFGDLDFTVQYKPGDYIAILECGKEGISREGKLEQIKSSLGEMQYYNFRVRTKNGGDLLQSICADQQQYQNALQYLSYEFQNDFLIVENEQDTLPCRLFSYVPNYNVAPYMDFTVAFDAGKLGAERKLIIRDRVFSGTILEYDYSPSEMKSLPELTY